MRTSLRVALAALFAAAPAGLPVVGSPPASLPSPISKLSVRRVARSRLRAPLAAVVAIGFLLLALSSPASAAPVSSRTYGYVRGMFQTFVVPSGVRSVQITAVGGSGGSGYSGGAVCGGGRSRVPSKGP